MVLHLCQLSLAAIRRQSQLEQGTMNTGPFTYPLETSTTTSSVPTRMALLCLGFLASSKVRTCSPDLPPPQSSWFDPLQLRNDIRTVPNTGNIVTNCSTTPLGKYSKSWSLHSLYLRLSAMGMVTTVIVTFLGLQFSFFTCLLILSHHVTFPLHSLYHMTTSPDRLPIHLPCDSLWLCTWLTLTPT